jgi:hypothetical protein
VARLDRRSARGRPESAQQIVIAGRTTPQLGELGRGVVTGLQPLRCKPPCEERRIVRRVAARWKLRLECSPRRRSRPSPTVRTKEAAGRAAYRAVMLRCIR